MSTKRTYRAGAIDSKRRLLQFFAVKEHHNLVLRIADVLDMRNDRQDKLIGIVEASMTGFIQEGELRKEATGWRKRYLLRVFPGGHIVLPFEQLLGPMTMDEVLVLQELCYAYASVRLGKGEPSRIDKCEPTPEGVTPRRDGCGGSGRFAGKKCKQCDGTGKIITFLQMSDDERQLATTEV